LGIMCTRSGTTGRMEPVDVIHDSNFTLPHAVSVRSFCGLIHKRKLEPLVLTAIR
jgi:hypothetical protein